MKIPLLSKLQKHLPGITFAEAKTFYWSPKTKTIFMNNGALETGEGQWTLVHEAAHAKLQHKAYKTDVGLLMLEVEAWQAAEQMSPQLDLQIHKEHIQGCLNTYRDWLYARSTCPTCELNSLMVEETVYVCLNCSTRWIVSKSRFCRPYRVKIPPENAQAVLN